MAVTTQPSNIKFLVQQDTNDGNNDADLKATHGLISGDVINAAAAVNTGVFPNAVTSKSATAGVGYSTGAGAAVTQASNKSTGVTINTPAGKITLNNANLATTVAVGFTVTNSAVAATDVVAVSIASGATANSYTVTVDAVAAGSFHVCLRNFTGGDLAEAVVISFAVIKAVAA